MWLHWAVIAYQSDCMVTVVIVRNYLNYEYRSLNLKRHCSSIPSFTALRDVHQKDQGTLTRLIYWDESELEIAITRICPIQSIRFRYRPIWIIVHSYFLVPSSHPTRTASSIRLIQLFCINSVNIRLWPRVMGYLNKHIIILIYGYS